VGCCARTASGQAAAALPRSVMNSRRLMASPSSKTTPYHIVEYSILHHSKFGRRWQRWVNHDWAGQAADPAMSEMPR
jgi:hypothetical protein